MIIDKLNGVNEVDDLNLNVKEIKIIVDHVLLNIGILLENIWEKDYDLFRIVFIVINEIHMDKVLGWLMVVENLKVI